MPNVPLDNGQQTPEQIAAHNAAMVAKADADAAAAAAISKPAPVVAPTRPDWCPEKFWDAKTSTVNQEALAKSYGELERSRSAAKTPEQLATEKAAADKLVADKAAADAAKTPEQLAAEKAAAAAAPKVDFDTVRAAAETEFANTGKLSPETYALLEKNHGFSKTMVDQYIAGAKATESAAAQSVFKGAGTDEATYLQAVTWAAENMSEADKVSFNNSLANADSAALAVKDLVAKFKANGDIEPGETLHGGDTSGSHFKSRAEMTAAMRDPKYKNDPAYRATVASKIDRAVKAKVDLFS